MEIKQTRKCASYASLGFIVFNALDTFKRFNTVPRDKKIKIVFDTIKEKAKKEIR